MAKNINGSKTNIAIAGLVIAVITIMTSGGTTYLNNVFQADETVKHVDDLKRGGCDPAIEGRTNIAVIDVRLENIEKDISELRTEQSIDTAEILKAIKEQ